MLTNAEVVEALEMIYRDVAGDARESAIAKIRKLQAAVRESHETAREGDAE